MDAPSLLFAAVTAAAAGLLHWRLQQRRRWYCWSPEAVCRPYLARTLAGELARCGWHLRGHSWRPLGDVAGDGYQQGFGGVSGVLELAVSHAGGGELVSPAPRVFAKFVNASYGIWWPYEAELRFWTALAPLCAGIVALPRALSVEADARRQKYVLLFEDVVHSRRAVHGDQLSGATEAQALAAVRAYARLHATFRGYASCEDGTALDTSRCPWAVDGVFSAYIEARRKHHLNSTSIGVIRELVARYTAGTLVSSEAGGVPEAMVAVTQRMGSDGCEAVTRACSLTPATATLVHGDSRLDNMLFASDSDVGSGSGSGVAVVLVDWAHIGYQSGLWDIAHFCGTSLTVAQRRAMGARLLAAYHAEFLRWASLRTKAPADPRQFTFAECQRQYRAASARVWNYFIGARFTSTIVQPSTWATPRLLQLLQAFAERMAWQILDNGVEDTYAAVGV